VGYPDDLLVSGERVVVHKHPHWKILVVPVLAFLLVVGVGTYLAALVRDRTWAPSAWLALGVTGLLLVLWLTVTPVIRWRTTHFVVTTRRLLVREGVLSRQGIDIPMNRINSVQCRNTLVERFLGCGTLVIDSAADEPLEFDDIPGVQRVHALLYHEVTDDG
jgi:uncharacterized membrane protein YdbT with pleckstrin-like domain